MARARARVASLVLTLLVAAAATISWPALGATAAPAPTRAPADVCSIEQWEGNFAACVEKLPDVVGDRATCLKAPTPSTPDAGLAGWFATKPEGARTSGVTGMNGRYGYAGYSYNTYDVEGGCASSVLHPDYRFLTTVANGEFMIATAVVGASNAVRERAWDPQSMWGWADPLVDQATKAVYTKVFTAFGGITLAIVGLYLIWRSRQSDMSNALTTTGWALLVMVAVTALAAWPVKSANVADSTLVSALGVVHDAVGPRPKDGQCILDEPQACKDNRPPAVRASDTVTETMLYRNWLRGILGSADSDVAKKYGLALYDAKSFTWTELQQIRSNPNSREGIIARKSTQWIKVAEQIKTEDPEAYEYLQGSRDMERVGAGFIALLAAILFALFDLTASLLVLLGFLIFRWAVIAAPILGTIGLMRPASAGIRRLANAVVAAVFNIAIFGTGAAIYLFAVDLVMNTPTLPGWLQVVLVWLTGVVGWLLLRPYRRITQLGGKDSTSAITSAGSWHRRFFRDMREAAKLDVAEPGGTAEPRLGKGRGVVVEQTTLRPEARLEDPSHAVPSGGERSRPEEHSDSPTPATPPAPQRAPAKSPARRQPARWVEPDVPETAPASYAIYRPESTKDVPAPQPRIRSEAR
ncbi:MFS transporter [Asanoa sp. WMMD1127]|uniref:MFS transporter n=1 Tax=Asanoa sp. WMMD1127 TaxID=3016107 RepID=UPI0024169EF6|nr:MFS transporter [Asanoa sp. WMMD1127]MDG4822417.1 MFS transporter [Asanoa sp. WMMD1127]